MQTGFWICSGGSRYDKGLEALHARRKTCLECGSLARPYSSFFQDKMRLDTPRIRARKTAEKFLDLTTAETNARLAVMAAIFYSAVLLWGLQYTHFSQDDELLEYHFPNP